MKRVGEIMSDDVITVGGSDRVGDAIVLLHEHDIRHLPVVDRGVLVGMVSDRQLRQCQPPLDGDDTSILFAVNLLDRPVQDFMSDQVVSVTVDDPIDAAIDAILQHNIGAVCVVGAGRAVIGIVSYVDILLALRLEHEAEHLPRPRAAVAGG